MMNKYKILSLAVVFLMLVAASMTVNKSVFGHKFGNDQKSENFVAEPGDNVTVLSDGTIVIHTVDIPGTVDGYAGPVPLDIYISDGKISDIKALPNAETPSFFDRASELMSVWIGKTPQEALSVNVDGISGATYSSMAIISNVNKGISGYIGSERGNGRHMPVKMWIALAVTLAACLLPVFVRSRLYHNIQMLANVIVLGFWCGQFLDYTLILKYISNGFIWPAGIVAIVMLIAAFIFPLLGHPQHYCTHICPLGSAQQLVAQICGYKIKLAPKVLKGLDWFRRLLWAALMLLLWADCLTGWMDLELFQAFQFESAAWWIIVVACVFIALSAVISRPYCRFVCPTGSLFKRSENIG